MKNKYFLFQKISMDNRIFMQDLESGLHLMFRNDIARFKLITGEKMKVLKEWLRILVKVVYIY